MCLVPQNDRSISDAYLTNLFSQDFYDWAPENNMFFRNLIINKLSLKFITDQNIIALVRTKLKKNKLFEKYNQDCSHYTASPQHHVTRCIKFNWSKMSLQLVPGNNSDQQTKHAQVLEDSAA